MAKNKSRQLRTRLVCGDTCTPASSRSPVLGAVNVQHVRVRVLALHRKVAGGVARFFPHHAEAVHAGHLGCCLSAAQPGKKPTHLVRQVVCGTHRGKRNVNWLIIIVAIADQKAGPVPTVCRHLQCKIWCELNGQSGPSAELLMLAEANR